ncbi:PIN domain-containing protein [Streptomyces sp. NBC_00424]|uniref:PIN domain-containing protein n=1 Tax=Streptomyces sp. NBC_00424 TaxID=2903648 RepID=UPI00224CDF11|nr:PIN domain-containing protein [Streptomyces sp. NBC_00424]MCX5079012.1 PIN domain-containing protein [Streptomyces sp. NBC_00424]
MIILDANILMNTSLRGPAADVLRAIRAADSERVATPWIAVEEVVAKQARLWEKKYAAAVAAVDELRKATPWAPVDHPRRWTGERARRHWRERYADITDVIETSPSAYQQAMYRETNLIAPCKTVNSGKHKTGARDAAIWLTAVEYAREHLDETVYFITNDGDFGDGTTLPAPMNRDIAGMEERFFLFRSLDGVLAKFATEVEATSEDVRRLLDTEDARRAILDATSTANQRYRTVSGTRLFPASNGDGDAYRLARMSTGVWAPTAVALDEVLEVNGREVGGHRWFTASVRWLLRERGLRQGEFQERAFAWETRLLLSTNEDKAITVLDSRRPSPITAENVPRLPEMPAEDDVSPAHLARLEAVMVDPSMRDVISGLAQLIPPKQDMTQMEAVILELAKWTQGATEKLRWVPIQAPADEE